MMYNPFNSNNASNYMRREGIKRFEYGKLSTYFTGIAVHSNYSHLKPISGIGFSVLGYYIAIYFIGPLVKHDLTIGF